MLAATFYNLSLTPAERRQQGRRSAFPVFFPLFFKFLSVPSTMDALNDDTFGKRSEGARG